MRAIKLIMGSLIALSVPSIIFFVFVTSSKAWEPYKYFPYVKSLDAHYASGFLLGIITLLLAVLIVGFGFMLVKESLEKK